MISVAVFLLLLEGAVRLSDHWNLIHFGLYDKLPGVPYKLRRGAEGANKEGFRDLDRPFKKPDGVYRILFLGDSYVYGRVPYEQNFPTLLEKQLNALGPEKKIEIVNLGVPGYGPEDSANLWEHYGYRYHPDAVIFGFFYDNDMTDNEYRRHSVSILGERVKLEEESRLDKSHLLAFLRAKWGLIRFNMTHNTKGKAGFFTDQEVESMIAGTIQIYDKRWMWGIQLKHMYVQSVFLRMQKLAALENAPLFVVRYPPETMANPKALESRILRMGENPKDYDRYQLGRHVGLMLSELSISSEDITPQIERALTKEPLYIPNDTHWNAAGNRAAADPMTPVIEEFLVRNGLPFERRVGVPEPHASQTAGS